MSTDDRTPGIREVRSMYCAGSNLYRETPEQHYLGAPAPDYGAEFDRFLARIRREAKAEALKKRWVCQVARSGYHNGASCRPDDAHNDWGCDYYYEASIRAAEYEAGDSDEHR